MSRSEDDSNDIVARAKAGDPDRYVAALLADDAQRMPLLVLAAFGAELADVARRVREPMMGEVRLQWWRDLVEGRGDPGGHPLAVAILELVENQRVDARVLVSMTEAHAFDLYSDPMPDEAAFWGYHEKISGGLFALGLQLLGVQNGLEVARHAGRAHGAARMLANLPWWRAKGRNPLPSTLLTPEDDMPEHFVAGRGAEAVMPRDLAAVVEQELAVASASARRLSRAERVVLLPLATISPYLAAIRKRPAIDAVADITPLRRMVAIARGHWLGL